MIPSANTASLASAPPENRFRKPSMLRRPPVEELLECRGVDTRHRDVRAEPVDGQHAGREEQLGAHLRDLPGVGQRLPEFVVQRSAPVRTAPRGALPRRRPPRSSRRAGQKACIVHCERHARSPPPRILTGVRVFFTMPWRTSASGVTSSPAAKRCQTTDVDRHSVGAEGPDGHALLHVRAAQLAEAHVDRHLAALVARAHAAAGARVVALVAACRRSCPGRCPCRDPGASCSQWSRGLGRRSWSPFSAMLTTSLLSGAPRGDTRSFLPCPGSPGCPRARPSDGSAANPGRAACPGGRADARCALFTCVISRWVVMEQEPLPTPRARLLPPPRRASRCPAPAPR